MTNAAFPETRATRTTDRIIARALEGFDRARRRTLELFSIVHDEAVLHRSPGFGYRPLLWHLAHVGVFEAYWILQRAKGDPPLDERYERLFDPIATPREDSTNLPSRDEMIRFLARVRERVESYARDLTRDDLTHTANPLLRGGYVFDLVLEHERQHQETLAYLLHLLPPESKRRPVASDAPPVSSSANDAPAMIDMPAGRCVVGAVWNSFAYDNELPAHERDVPAFRIRRTPVTNADYAEFIAAGGYARPELWSAEGWARRAAEGWTAPLYWERDGDGWLTRGMFDRAPLMPDHPVSGVSWYEADAYARFRGMRMPTEAEWEKAASWDARANRKRRFAWGDDEPHDTKPARCNCDLQVWGTTPIGAYPEGASPYGCLDMTGNVWEWTSTAFAGYEGFEAFPYPEYSEKWFDGDHRVLKGGSWATSPAVLRTSFRNFFRRDFRIAFAGIRLAADV